MNKNCVFLRKAANSFENDIYYTIHMHIHDLLYTNGKFLGHIILTQ